MNWDQIEQKWAEMARRVRSDIPSTVARAGAGNPATAPQTPAIETPPPLAAPVSGA